MIIEDRGILLAYRNFQENGCIVDCLLENHGLIKGYTRKSRKLCVLTPGGFIKVNWRARLESQLGFITLENEKSTSPLVLLDNFRNLALASALAMVISILHERETHTEIYQRMETFLNSIDLDNDSYLENYALLEVELLSKAGFGLDLAKCAKTGITDNLRYVSPKTGRAVSADVGMIYHSRLFPLPQFLRYEGNKPTINDIHDTLTITGHFFGKHIWYECKSGEPASRARLKTALRTRDAV